MVIIGFRIAVAGCWATMGLRPWWPFSVFAAQKRWWRLTRRQEGGECGAGISRPAVGRLWHSRQYMWDALRNVMVILAGAKCLDDAGLPARELSVCLCKVATGYAHRQGSACGLVSGKNRGSLPQFAVQIGYSTIFPFTPLPVGTPRRGHIARQTDSPRAGSRKASGKREKNQHFLKHSKSF